MQLRGSEYRSRKAERVLGASAQKPRERDAEQARGHAKLVSAHAEAAKSCTVPERAIMGDTEALEADAMPPEADAGRFEVMLGQRV